MTDTHVDEFLEHFGVKGMRWGHRTGGADGGGSGGSSRGGSSSDKPAKPTSRDIKDARARTRERAKDLGKKEEAYYSATTTAGREKALNIYKKAENKVLSHPDTKLADTLTRGEKIANGVSTGMSLALIAGGLALTVASARR